MDLLILMLTNVAIIVCFTILAVVFNHWWIVLFGALFLYSYKNDNQKTDKNKEE